MNDDQDDGNFVGSCGRGVGLGVAWGRRSWDVGASWCHRRRSVRRWLRVPNGCPAPMALAFARIQALPAHPGTKFRTTLAQGPIRCRKNGTIAKIAPRRSHPVDRPRVCGPILAITRVSLVKVAPELDHAGDECDRMRPEDLQRQRRRWARLWATSTELARVGPHTRRTSRAYLTGPSSGTILNQPSVYLEVVHGAAEHVCLSLPHGLPRS